MGADAGGLAAHRSLTVDVRGAGHAAGVREFLISACTIAENARYQVIRQRHDGGMDLSCVPESARILIPVAATYVMINAGAHPPAADVMKEISR